MCTRPVVLSSRKVRYIFVFMKRIAKYILGLFMALSLQTNTVFAQFNTIQEYVYFQNQSGTNSIQKKSCQPTAGSILADSIKAESKNKSVQKKDYSRIVALPLKRIHITSSFGRRIHPITKKHSLHNGIDLRASYEEVYSMLPGTVHKTGEDKRSGKYIIVSTGDYKISYCHLSEIRVRQGENVIAGMPIAISGDSGLSTGPHLHLTIRIAGKLHNPETFLRYINVLQNT